MIFALVLYLVVGYGGILFLLGWVGAVAVGIWRAKP